MPTDSPQTAKPSPPANEAPLPIKRVFLAALLPALLGLSVGLFIVPPRMGFDPAVGLLAWMNFVTGGTWNTIPVPDPNNIAQTIEVAVTWWPPGQYLFLGLLNLAGLSFGHAALLLAFLSTLSGATGLAMLGKELGAPSRALPWIAAALACSQYNLVNYQYFWGGEPLIMALWPWVAITAWRLRNNDKLLICTLPPLFLLGAFIKHSFAIYAFCILLFLWSEKLIYPNSQRTANLSKKVKAALTSALPLALVGIIFIIGRHYLINTEISPAQRAQRYLYSLPEIIGYPSISPLTSITSLKGSLLRLIGSIFHLEPHTTRLQVAPTLAVISPLFLSLYLYLSKRKKQILRFAGISSIATVFIFFTFHFSNYSIDLEDRHYSQAGSLFLVAITAYAFDRKKLSSLAFIFILGAMGFGISRFTRLAYTTVQQQPPIGGSGTLAPHPHTIMKEFQSLAQMSNSIITAPYPILDIETEALRHPSTHFFLIYRHGFEPAMAYKGRVSKITIAISPEDWVSGKDVMPLFVDYAEDEWKSYEIDGWTFWQVGHSENMERTE